MSTFKCETVSAAEAELIELGVMHDPVARLPFDQILTIQFAKLINYWRNETTPEWGGQCHESSPSYLQSAHARFQQDVGVGPDGASRAAATRAKWLHRLDRGREWGPRNVCLRPEHSEELGYPFEPYIAVNGAILTLNQASRVLSMTLDELIQAKLAIIHDDAIVDEAITRMLRPRSEWPRIFLKPGGKGRVVKLRENEK